MSVISIFLTVFLMLDADISFAELRWEQVDSAMMPSARSNLALAYDSTTGQVVLYGGVNKVTNYVYADTWLFHAESMQWGRVATTHDPGARHSMVSGISNGRLYITMGMDDHYQFLADVWSFSIGEELWRKESVPGSIPPARAQAVGGIALGSSLFYVAFGFSKIRHLDMWSYNLANQSWQLVTDKSLDFDPFYPSARYGHAGTTVGDNGLLLFGGCLSGKGGAGPCPSKDSWLYTNATWTRLAECVLPRYEASLAAIHVHDGGTENHVILYGGSRDILGNSIHVNRYNLDQVNLFNVGSRMWRNVRTVAKRGFPPLRFGHSMTATPIGVFVFGGNSLTDTPLKDTWLLAVDGLEFEYIPCSSDWSFSYMQAHAVAMVTAWGFLLPAGAFLSRYRPFKRWKCSHITFQLTGLVLTVIGIAFAAQSRKSDHVLFLHGFIGVVIATIALSQTRFLYTRTVDRFRVVVLTLHHVCGRVALVLALVNISLGLILAVVPWRYMVYWAVYLALLVVLFVVCEVGKWKNQFASDQRPNLVRQTKTGSMEFSVLKQSDGSPDLSLHR